MRKHHINTLDTDKIYRVYIKVNAVALQYNTSVYPLRIVVAEDVSEDNSFDFFTLHSVCRYLIQFFFFQCGKETLHTGIIVAMGSTAKALDEPVCNKFPAEGIACILAATITVSNPINYCT